MAAVLAAHEADRPLALRTSGSTGTSRSVLRTTASWMDSFDEVARLTELRPESRVWLPGPQSATMNLFAAVLARSLGARVVRDPADVTHAHLTPLVLARALDAEVPLQGVRVTVAGERLPRALLERATAAGARVSHYYGAAELSFVAWGSHDGDLRPFLGVEIDVRSGEIWVRSRYLCTGYAAAPGPFRRDLDGFATVGDRGMLRAGTLVVAGRGVEAITTGGATVLTADVEQALRGGVRGDLAVVGTPHAELGQVVCAVLTREADLPTAATAARTGLEGAQRPRRWFHLADLPTTPAGKLDRTALTTLVAAGRARRLDPVTAAAEHRERLEAG